MTRPLASLPKLSAEETCVKCGCEHPAMEYRTDPNRLLVTCVRCGFAWHRAPLDAHPDFDLSAVVKEP